MENPTDTIVANEPIFVLKILEKKKKNKTCKKSLILKDGKLSRSKC